MAQFLLASKAAVEARTTDPFGRGPQRPQVWADRGRGPCFDFNDCKHNIASIAKLRAITIKLEAGNILASGWMTDPDGATNSYRHSYCILLEMST